MTVHTLYHSGETIGSVILEPDSITVTLRLDPSDEIKEILSALASCLSKGPLFLPEFEKTEYWLFAPRLGAGRSPA